MDDNTNLFGIEPKLWEKIQALRLLDDLLMQTVMDGFIPGAELILRIILDMPARRIYRFNIQDQVPGDQVWDPLLHRQL